MLTLHVEAATVNQLIERALAELHINLLPNTAPPTMPGTERMPPPPSPPAPPTTEPSQPAPEKKRVGRPPKVAVPAPAVPPAAEATAPPPAPAAPDIPAEPVAAAGAAPTPKSFFSKEEVRAALHSVTVRVKDDVNESAGLKRAYDVLASLGYRKISEVKEEDHFKLITACKDKMNGLVLA
jgi:hypothetical protein